MRPASFYAGVWLLVLTASIRAAEPALLFEEPFNGRLSEGWTWLREQPEFWRFGTNALEICVQPGAADNVKNALLRDAPDRSKGTVAVEVTVTFTSSPSNQFEQAGLTFYQAGKPVLKLVHELIDGATYIIPGKRPTTSPVMQLRLVLSKDRYIAQFRPDGQGEFQTAGSGPLAPGAHEQISVQCYNGPTGVRHWMRFTAFRVLKLND